MDRYPVYKKGDKVKIVGSTLSPNRSTLRLVERGRQAIIIGRRARRRGEAPSYNVQVKIYQPADSWNYSDYYYDSFAFNATDLEKWVSRARSNAVSGT